MSAFLAKIGSREASFISVLVALGTVSRIGLAQLALGASIPFYGVVIKLGLTETLAFIGGFILGPQIGFVTGFLIIALSDLFLIPGPWTPLIGAIIGLFGFGGGLFRRHSANPSDRALALFAVAVTVLSEFLQNLVFSIWFSVPLLASLAAGLPATLAAIANNTILLTTLGSRITAFVDENMIVSKFHQPTQFPLRTSSDEK